MTNSIALTNHRRNSLSTRRNLSGKHHGSTLIELIIVLAATAVVLLLAVPQLEKWLTKSRIEAARQMLYHDLSSARFTAISTNQSVLICASSDQVHCATDWEQGYMIFVDHNGNKKVDEDEVILASRAKLSAGDTLKWRAFQNKSALRYLPTGATAYQNGTFTFCGNGSTAFARALISTKTGRLRMSYDRDGDGIHEGANGGPLSC